MNNKLIIEYIVCPICKNHLSGQGGFSRHLRARHNYSKEQIQQEKNKLLNVITKVDHNKKIKIEKIMSERSVDYYHKRYNKTKSSNLQKYGVENVYQADCIKEKCKRTNLLHHGVENGGGSEQALKKIKATNLSKLGVEYSWQAKSVKENIKKTMVLRYGVDNPQKSTVIRRKTEDTCVQRFGTTSPLGNREKIELGIQTNLRKYGVERPAQSALFYLKNMYNLKDFILPSGKIIKVQGYEPYCISMLLKAGFGEDDLIIGDDIGKHCSIWYMMGGTKHRYFPDILIKRENIIIEVKSEYTVKTNTAQMNLKYHAAKITGFIPLLFVFDRIGNIVSTTFYI
jgi:hypothetical protein